MLVGSPFSDPPSRDLFCLFSRGPTPRKPARERERELYKRACSVLCARPPALTGWATGPPAKRLCRILGCCRTRLTRRQDNYCSMQVFSAKNGRRGKRIPVARPVELYVEAGVGKGVVCTDVANKGERFSLPPRPSCGCRANSASKQRAKRPGSKWRRRGERLKTHA